MLISTDRKKQTKQKTVFLFVYTMKVHLNVSVL